MRGIWQTGVNLPVLLTVGGLIVTFVHDYAYRRADTAGTGDYEFGGLVSHAGTDMLILTAVLAFTAWIWLLYNQHGQP